VILKELPKTLRDEVVFDMHRGLIAKIPFFRKKPFGFISNMIRNLKFATAPTNSTIIEQGEHRGRMSDIFFILTGSVAVSKNNEVIGGLGAGTYFGEMSVLLPARQAMASIRTLEKTEFGTIDGPTYIKLLRAYPEVQFEVTQIINKRHKAMSVHMGVPQWWFTQALGFSGQEEEFGPKFHAAAMTIQKQWMKSRIAKGKSFSSKIKGANQVRHDTILHQIEGAGKGLPPLRSISGSVVGRGDFGAGSPKSRGGTAAMLSLADGAVGAGESSFIRQQDGRGTASSTGQLPTQARQLDTPTEMEEKGGAVPSSPQTPSSVQFMEDKEQPEVGTQEMADEPGEITVISARMGRRSSLGKLSKTAAKNGNLLEQFRGPGSQSCRDLGFKKPYVGQAANAFASPISFNGSFNSPAKASDISNVSVVDEIRMLTNRMEISFQEEQSKLRTTMSELVKQVEWLSDRVDGSY
jgi:hypothetical protein